MTDTCLQIVQNIAAEVGIAQPATVIGNTDPNPAQILAMLNREGRDLAKSHDWMVLVRLFTFDTVASQGEYAFPSDYDHLVRNTEWDQANHRPLIGPLSAQEWETIKQGLIGSVLPYRRYRLLRSASSASKVLYVDPVPTTNGEVLGFEYVSNGWATDSLGTTLRTSFAADTDVPLLSTDLLTLGTIVRWKRALGLEFASESDEYQLWHARSVSRDKPATEIDITRKPQFRLLSALNTPIGTIGQ